MDHEHQIWACILQLYAVDADEIIHERELPERSYRGRFAPYILNEMEEDTPAARNSRRNIATINVPYCKGTTRQLNSELKSRRKYLNSVESMLSLEEMVIDYIFKNQEKFCNLPLENAFHLSPQMQMKLLKRLETEKWIMQSSVYYDFLIWILNKNTWFFSDNLAPRPVNNLAVYKHLRKECHNLKQLCLHKPFPSSLLDYPNFAGLTSLICNSVVFDEWMLTNLSKMVELQYLQIDLAPDLTEESFAPLTALSKLVYLMFDVRLISRNSEWQQVVLSARERYILFLYKYVPLANIVVNFGEEFALTSYALENYFKDKEPRVMGQTGLRLVDITAHHENLHHILPRLTTLHIDNMFHEFTQESVEPLTQFAELSKISLKNSSIHLCHKFFRDCNSRLVDIHIDCCRKSSYGLDLGLLFHYCHNLKFVKIDSQFEAETSFTVKQSYVNSLESVRLTGENEANPPEAICSLILQSPNLNHFSTTSDLINALNNMPHDLILPKLNNLKFKLHGTYGIEDLNDALAILNSLVKLAFNSPRLKLLTLHYRRSTYPAIYPIKLLLEGIAKVNIIGFD